VKLRQILDVFGPQNFRGIVPQNVYPNSHTRLAADHMEKFGGAIRTYPKVIISNMLNILQIFDFSLLKNCSGDLCLRLHVRQQLLPNKFVKI